jgi:high-affinity iron transporter
MGMALDWSAALPAFVITLREGVEAALVVGIVLAYLEKAKQAQLKLSVLGGVASGIVASVLVGWFLNWLVQTLTAGNQPYTPVIKPLLEGSFSVLAIAMLSWMLIWMTQQARSLKTEVEGAVGTALQAGTAAAWGVFGLVFLAVVREGFETVLFLSAQVQAGWMPVIGAIAGILGAALIGLLLFQWGVKINLRRFFQVMGVLLLLIVAGLVVSALRKFDAAIAILAQINQQPAWCLYSNPFDQPPACILGAMVWNFSSLLPDNQLPGIILRTLFGYRDKLYVVQAIAYLCFLITVGGMYLQSITGWTILPSKNKATET